MNSSGIKRGLATTAVSALAVAGIPFIATSASAAPGDTLGVVSTGPIRDANAAGGSVVLKSNVDTIVQADLLITNADYSAPVAFDATGPEKTSPAFDLDVISLTLLDGNPNVAGNQKFADGFFHYDLTTAVTLGTATKATFGVVEDSAGDGINANDPKTVVEVTPTGAPAIVSVSPANQTTAATVQSPNYTVQVKDANGFLTQLVGGEGFNVTSTADAAAVGALNSTTLSDGVATFTATAPTAGTKPLEIKGNGTGETPISLLTGASLTVVAQATITADEFDIATGADTWSNTSTFGSVNTEIRVDQGTVTFNFVSDDKDATPGADDAGKVVLLTLSSGTLKFDGENTKTYPVVLDSAGRGTLAVSPSGIVDGSQFTFASTGSGIASTTVTFNRAEAKTVKSDATAYVTKIGDPTTVVVSVVDQFGNAIGAPAQVSINRGARNGSTTTARQTVGADGKATFTLPDAGTGVGQETFTINLFEDQFDGSANTENANTPFTGGTINYTVDGLGGDFIVSGAFSDAALTKVFPLYDASATDAGDEFETITVTGGTPGATVQVSVDNGLVLTGADTALTRAAASKSFSLNGGGVGSFKVIGTKTGVANVTITTGGRTKIVSYTVEQPTGNTLAATARNVELEGPESVVAGDVATYVATVTDAFGNTVAGVDQARLAWTVSGPGNLQNEEAATDANGELEQTVLLTDNADGSITVRVVGTGAQFGSRANEIGVAPANTAAAGLSASVDNDSVTSAVKNLDALEQEVAEAEEALEDAQQALAAAQGNLDVAATELAVAQANVDMLQAKKVELRKKLNKAKANDNRQKAKTTRKKLRNVKRNLRAAQDQVTIATAKVAAAQGVVDNRTQDVADAQADLDEAKQRLEDAQN